MRLVAWNCSMALHRKFDTLLSARPDIAVISECAEPERLRRKLGSDALDVDPLWIGSNPNKGLAVFAFNGYRIRRARNFDPSLQWILPVKVVAPESFHLFGVWAQNASAGIRRKSQPGPLRLALDHYRRSMASRAAILAGDFNNNIFWDKPGWPMNHADAVAVMDSYGLVSAYHACHHERQGEESKPTHYWRDRKEDGPTYHIDYVFMPGTWIEGIREMSVGTFEQWCSAGLSDHAPLVVDVDLGVR